MEKGGTGVEVGRKYIYIYSLQFADDQVIVAQDKDDLEYMTRKTYEEYGKWDMKINTDRMKCISIGGPNGTIELENGGKTLPYSEYNYLSMIIDEDGIHTKNNKRRIQQGRTCLLYTSRCV